MSAAHLNVYTNKTAGAGVGNLGVTLTGADVRVGDRLCLVVCADGNSTQDGVRYDSDTGDSAGFTLIGSSTQSCTVYAFHKHAASRDEGAPTYNFKIASGTEKMVVSVLHIRGDDGLDGTPAFLQNVLDSTPDSPSVTTSEDDALVYHFLGIKTAGGTVITPPSGETLVFDDADGGGGGIRFACYRTTQVSAGATGAEGWVIDAANDSIGFTIAFKLGELQRDYAPAASGAKKVYIEGYASKVGGSAAHTGYPLLITDSVLKTNNLNMFDSGHADAATEGSIRFSLDEAGVEPLPGKVHFAAAADPANGELEAYTRRPTNDGSTDSGNGVYMWWIPGSAKTQPAASAQHGSESVQPYSYRMNIIGGVYTDETVNGNDATPTNVALSTNVPFGHLESFDFNGVSSRMNVPDSNSLDLADGTSFTLLAWMITDSDTGTFQGLMSKRQNLVHNYGAFFIADDASPNPGTFHANFYNGAFRGVTMNFDPNFAKNTWMPVFVEFEDVGTDYTIRIYNATTLVNSAIVTQEPLPNAQDLVIGCTQTGVEVYGEWMDGRQKGIRVIAGILSADVKTTIVNNESDNAAFWNGQWVYTDADGDGKGSAGGVSGQGAIDCEPTGLSTAFKSTISQSAFATGLLATSTAIKNAISQGADDDEPIAISTHTLSLSGQGVGAFDSEPIATGSHVTARSGQGHYAAGLEAFAQLISARTGMGAYDAALYATVVTAVNAQHPAILRLTMEYVHKLALTIERVNS